MAQIGNPPNILATYVYSAQELNIGNVNEDGSDLAKPWIQFSPILRVIHACQSISRSLSPSNHQGAIEWLQKGAELAYWLAANIQVKRRDFLIIPLNTDENNTRHCQQAMIELLREACGHDNTRVCTLSDYICSDEILADMTDEVRAFVDGQHEIIYELLREQLAPNLIFLVGNEDNISNKWSRLMHEGALNDDQRYKYWRLEPVSERTIRKLHFFEKGLRGVTLDMLNQVETISENPAHFRGLVDRGQVTSPAWESHANEWLTQRTLQHFDMPSNYSDELHTITEAQERSTGQDDILRSLLDDPVQLAELDDES